MPDNNNTRGPLAHITILDFSQLLQGPMATQILGDLGAEVIKVEKPGGEWMRHWGIENSWTHGETDSFLAFNRNKKSVEADLKDPTVVERILELAKTADVVVENFRPGIMNKLGFGYDKLKEVNPGIIYASSSGYGRTGPYSKRPGQDMLAQALSGLMSITGRKEDPPIACGVGISDEMTGLYLTIGILAALEHRSHTGEGQRIEVDLLSCSVAAQQQELTVYLNSSVPPSRPHRNIGHVGGTGPQGIYPTSDGFIALAMFPCPELGQALGVSWLDEFDTNELMFTERDRIHTLVSEHLATNTTNHWIEILSQHDVWCAPVRTYDQLEQDPQVMHKRLFWDVPVGEDENTCRTVGSPLTFSKTPASLRQGVPHAGQHTAEFLGDGPTPND